MAVHDNTAAIPITVRLSELEDGSVPLSLLENAFGPSSLGIIIVKDLPRRFVELRHQVLTYSSYLANLSENDLAALEKPDINYLVGWSLGKETLKSGQYDTLKGSYYINCGSFWRRGTQKDAFVTEVDGGHEMPEYTAESIWPAESVLSGFRQASEELCCLIIDIAILVAQACDRFGEQSVKGYRQGCLEHVVQSSRTTKARLLHYFPSGTATNGHAPNGSTKGEEDNWCATHLDHGCLTGLTSAMYVDEQQSPPQLERQAQPMPLTELPASPDPKAGLYIRSRSGAVTQVKIPRDCLAFQTGEALELMTKGRFKAVPHFVRGVGSVDGGAHVARNTLAVFTQPNLGEIVDEERGIDFGTFAKEIVARNT